MQILKVSSNGQLTLPKWYRDKVKVEYFVFQPQSDKSVSITPAQVSHEKVVRRDRNTRKAVVPQTFKIKIPSRLRKKKVVLEDCFFTSDDPFLSQKVDEIIAGSV